MMRSSDFAKRFTDIEYLSKREIGERVSIEMMDTIWKLTNEYREKYRFAIELKRNDRLPFSIVLTPSIMSLANTAEQLLFQYAQVFNKHSIYQSLSENKSLDAIKEKMLVDDLTLFAHNYGISASSSEVIDLVNGKETRLKESPVEGLLKVVDHILSNPEVKLDHYLLKQLFIALNHLETNLDAPMYRDVEIGSTGYSSIGVTPIRIPDHMKMLFDFIDADYEMSPFIIGAIVYAYFNYVLPFNASNNEIALLLMQKVIADAGYGEASYYAHATQYFMQSYDEANEIINEVRKTGDFTYAITFVAKMYIDSISFALKSITKLPLPKILGGEVRVIEKIVEVPVEVIKEVIREVPVEVERIVYVNTQDGNKGTNNAYVGEKIRVPHIIEDEVKQENYEIEPKREPQKTFSFAENDPFLTTSLGSAETIKEEAVKKTETVQEAQVIVETPVVVVEEKPKPEIVAKPIEEIEFEQINLAYLKKLEGLDPESYAYQLMQLNPNIRIAQAKFYAEHRTAGYFYTISQFRQFSDCAYETARTSMDFLAAIALYDKKLLKNKYVYTPTVLVEGSEE